ncbi:MAG: hypothetical protein JNL82_13210 [Myxococcales bacterium]|nr:hypothetical protein [Myxococcales bacterium]
MLLPAALAPVLALAEPSIALDWQAPRECPDAASVRAMTLDLLRRQPSDAVPPPVDVRVVVARSGDRWRATLSLRSSLGRVDRKLGAGGCPPLARAVALLVAVHLDPTAVSRRLAPLLDPPAPPVLPPEPSAAAPPELSSGTAPTDLSSGTAASGTPPAPTDLSSGTAPTDLSSGTAASGTSPAPTELSSGTATAAEAPPPALAPSPAAGDELPSDLSPRPAPTRGPLRGHLRLAGGFDGGLLPGYGGDVELAGGLGGRHWRVEAGVLGVPRRIQPATDTTPGGRFDRVVGLARACAVWRIPPRREQVALLGCLGAEAGGMHAVATSGAAVSRWIPWSAALLGAGARIPLVGPLGLWVGVEAAIALRRPAFTAGEDQSTVFTISRAGVRANLGFDLQFVARKRRPPTTD